MAKKKHDPNAERRCTKERPCPNLSQAREWFHDFETNQQGILLVPLVCRHCGYEVKSSPPR